MNEAPPVVFVVLDGTRKDRLSLYGHGRETSPNLEALAEDAVVFDTAYAPAAWSLPSHTSMFSGLYPSEHGITNVFSGESFGSPEALETLAERLSARGYRTGGFSANPWLGQSSGLDEGFDLFVEWDLKVSSGSEDWTLRRRERLHSLLHGVIGKTSEQPLALPKDGFFTRRLFSSASRWIAADGRPSYTFINVMGSHTPYYPSRSAFEDLGLERPSLLEPRLLNARIVRNQLAGEGTATSNTERVREYYDSTIRSQDERLGAFIEDMRAAGVYDEALIIVTADHGKTLGEFDRNGTPSHTVRDVNVNVPLVVKFPHQRSHTRLDAPFELVDLGKFVLTEEPRPTLAVNNTKPYALVEDYVPHTASESTDVTRWRAFTDGTHKYVVDDEGTEFLLEGTGPDETLTTDRSRLRELRGALETRLSTLDNDVPATMQGTEELDEEVEAQLRDIGYLG